MFYNLNMDYISLNLKDFTNDEILLLAGPNQNNIKVLKEIYNCDINLRDNVLMFYGNSEYFELFKKHINSLVMLIIGGVTIDENSIRQSYLNLIEGADAKWQMSVCAYTFNNKPILYKTHNQYLLSKSIDKNDLVFSFGPAGTGKTFISVLLAYKYYKKGLVDKIILTRPAVETGESLGFLPGDLKEKVDPYLSPIYDALYYLFGQEHTESLKTKNIIEIIPLAYMRGRTLNNAFIILDEAQNTTPGQMLMFLTRLGNNSKMIVNGDLTQIDLNLNKTKSGLTLANEKLKDVDGIGFIEFNNDDIIRNKLVKKVLERYKI